MNPIANPCDEKRLHVLVDGQEDSDAFRLSAAHVETCPRCQNRLVELAGRESDWHDARVFLSDDDDVDQHGRLNDRHLNDRHLNDRHLNTAAVQSYLDPPSHPEMLGRLGRYEIERLIGAGGMGVVLKGFDTELNRPVAVKALAPHLAHNAAARQRFAREARAAAAIVHESVVAIHDVRSDAKLPFLVMQFVPGGSLQTRLDQEGPLETKEILRIAVQVAQGLAAAHAQGVIHRDVKPSNILIENDVERVVLGDFGLARAADDASLTSSGIVAGTPHYMSPEQARGEPLDDRADLFSLGGVIYAMCTGRPPFRAEQAMAVLRRICEDRARAVHEVNPEIPAWMTDLVEKLLAKDRRERFSSATEAAEVFQRYLAHVQNPATVPLPARVGGARRTKRRFRRRLAAWIAAAASLVLIAGWGAWQGWKAPASEQAQENGAGQSMADYVDDASWDATVGSVRQSADAMQARWNQVPVAEETMSAEIEALQSEAERLEHSLGGERW